MLNLSENLIRFRKERKLTQSDVAQHLGITKASVSKWETGQTMPDVALLPLIASFYGVTLDELMGYEPMLTNQQIQAIYERFTSRFASESFDSIFTDIQIEIRRYYSCCPFLYQIAVLLLNHCNPKIYRFSLHGSGEKKQRSCFTGKCLFHSHDDLSPSRQL